MEHGYEQFHLQGITPAMGPPSLKIISQNDPTAKRQHLLKGMAPEAQKNLWIFMWIICAGFENNAFLTLNYAIQQHPGASVATFPTPE